MNIEELKCINENINIEGYLQFTKKVQESMLNPEWLGSLDKEYLINQSQNGYKIWMYYINNEPVCSMMLMPTREETITKLNLKYNYQEVADYGPMMVNIKYIGNSLQYQMLKQLDEYSIKQGYKYALATVHPDNIYSINNFIKDNFIEIGTRQFKRGLRNIYFKKLV